jgi:hypothetical protein
MAYIVRLGRFIYKNATAFAGVRASVEPETFDQALSRLVETTSTSINLGLSQNILYYVI